jgi:DNA helicase MCM8
MPNEHQALLEVLEQQTVSLAKAGITVNLPARTSVVAAANPVGGVYNRSKSIMNNLKMNPALLSRFDLLFLIVDDPDEELDEYRTRHVLATHNPEGEEATLRLQHAQQKLLAHHAHVDEIDDEDEGGERRHGAEFMGEKRSSLRRRLQLDLAGADAEFAPLPHNLMRKYITYANVHCFPRLTPEAGTILQAFYLELRAADTVGEDYPPITPRQLEALIRLAEARAKVELRETVTEDDARDAVEIMRETMRDVLEGGGLAGKRGFSGKGNKNVKAKMFVEAMNRRAIEKDSAYFTMGELYAIVDDLQLQIQDVDGFIEGLNMAGDILKSGRLYKSASS